MRFLKLLALSLLPAFVATASVNVDDINKVFDSIGSKVVEQYPDDFQTLSVRLSEESKLDGEIEDFNVGLTVNSLINNVRWTGSSLNIGSTVFLGALQAEGEKIRLNVGWNLDLAGNLLEGYKNILKFGYMESCQTDYDKDSLTDLICERLDGIINVSSFQESGVKIQELLVELKVLVAKELEKSPDDNVFLEYKRVLDSIVFEPTQTGFNVGIEKLRLFEQVYISRLGASVGSEKLSGDVKFDFAISRDEAMDWKEYLVAMLVSSTVDEDSYKNLEHLVLSFAAMIHGVLI